MTASSENYGTNAKPLGWWTISGEDLLAMLNRVADGEDPDMVYAEAYVNSDIENVEDP